MTLYTTDCPKCKVLEAKLNAKSLQYNTETNIDVMKEKGFLSAPILETDDGDILEFGAAVKYVNSL